jgi:two-component system CheB/CheR fusion protein
MSDASDGHSAAGAEGLLAQERQARALAERDSRAKDRLLAVLVHDLRNPLTPIRNAVAILRRQAAGDPAVQLALDQLDRQSQQLTRILEELLDLSQLGQGRLALHQETVDLRQAVGQVTAALQPALASRKVRLNVSLPAESATVEGDPARLKQVLGSMLLFALKHTPADGCVALAVTRQGEAVTVRVRDGGPGVRPEDLAHFFDLGAPGPFAGRGPGNAGIGLLLAHGLVGLHGGSMEVASAGPGHGTELVVRLPAAAAAPPATAPPGEPGPAPADTGRRRRILYVEDDLEIAESMEHLLQEMGYETRVAHSGPEALTLAESYRPQAVLLDIDLPGMDGYELARQLRARPGLEGVVLAAVSGYGQEEDRRRSRAAGIDHHLVKPVRSADVERALRGGP